MINKICTYTHNVIYIFTFLTFIERKGLDRTHLILHNLAL